MPIGERESTTGGDKRTNEGRYKGNPGPVLSGQAARQYGTRPLSGATLPDSGKVNVDLAKEHVNRLLENILQAVVVKREIVELAVVALLAEGHVLLEDVPGTGKTLLAKCLARSIDAGFKRIQFTPDLLPTDITGSSIYHQRTQEFVFTPGPVFGNIILADEINRATPRTQSSLLEAMGERQVTTEGVTHPLPQPFFVIATQNSVENYGTFPLPEAQLDRFLLSFHLGYPDEANELLILEREEHDDPLRHLNAALTSQDILKLQQEVRQVHVALSLKKYIIALVKATRAHPDVIIGVSPRGAVSMQRAAQALALVEGRAFVLPDDIKRLATYVLAHRLTLKPAQRLSTAEIIKSILAKTAVPIG